MEGTSTSVTIGLKHKLDNSGSSEDLNLIGCSSAKVNQSPSASLHKPNGSIPTHYIKPVKISRICKTVPSSPIWQMSPSHEINCDWVPPSGGAFHVPTKSLGTLVALKLKKERNMFIDEWVNTLKQQQEQLKRSADDKENQNELMGAQYNKQLEEMKKKLRDELTEEYERRLGEAEERLKAELASREEIETSLSNELQAKDSLLDGEKKKLQDTLDILETELQCSICSELFINAVTLGCSHSYCEFCINSWKSKCYTQSQCPICRKPIKTEVRSIVLDQYIGRIVEKLDEELVDVRNEIVHQRRELEEMQMLKEKLDREESAGGTVASSITFGDNDGSASSSSNNNGANGSSGGSISVHSRINQSNRINTSGNNGGGPFGGPSNHRGGAGSSSSRYSSGIAGSSRGNSRNNSSGQSGVTSAGGGRYGNHGHNRSYNGGSSQGNSHRTAGGSGGGGGSNNHHAYRPYRSSLASRHRNSGIGGGDSSNGAGISSGLVSSSSVASSFHSRIGTLDVSSHSSFSGGNSAGGSSSYNSAGGNGGHDYSNGLPGRYFGGYGHCFKCGRRGHWANGCPF